MVWAGLKGAEPMAHIASHLERSLEPLGFAPEAREFKAHLTLARVKDPSAATDARRIAESYSQAEFGRATITEIFLKKSVLRPQGPEYSTVLSVKLLG